MPRQIYVNLPVKNLQASIDFFTKLGFTFNAQFTDETATCMIISDTIYAMLLTHQKFKSFISTEIADAQKVTEVINCISLETRAAVDEMVQKAIAGGGRMHNAAIDHGFMYIHGFQDLDGHLWELIYLVPNPESP